MSRWVRWLRLYGQLAADFVMERVRRPFAKTAAAHGFWLTGSNCGHYFDDLLAEALCQQWQGETVIDFGCGKGKYVACLARAGISCRGYDGNPQTRRLASHCQVADLAERLDVDPADWVLSLEVGEHIPKEFEAVYLANLAKHARRGIVLSWAVPGQAGRGHVNCQTNDYIRQQLRQLGFQPDCELETRLRAAAWLPWFRHTLMAFRPETSRL